MDLGDDDDDDYQQVAPTYRKYLNQSQSIRLSADKIRNEEELHWYASIDTVP